MGGCVINLIEVDLEHDRLIERGSYNFSTNFLICKTSGSYKQS